jgi:hypothetical protein
MLTDINQCRLQCGFGSVVEAIDTQPSGNRALDCPGTPDKHARASALAV